MNAVTVYVNTAKLVLQSTVKLNSSTSQAIGTTVVQDICRMLIILRQLLSCVVCCRLLNDPYMPRHGHCMHNVCRLCVQGKKTLQPICNYCHDKHDFKSYNENKQMRCLLLCYKSMCEHVNSSILFGHLAGIKLNTFGILSPGISMPSMSMQELVIEGLTYDDVLNNLNSTLPKPLIVDTQTIAPIPILISPLSTSAVTPSAPIKQSINNTTFNQTTPIGSTPPNTILTISNSKEAPSAPIISIKNEAVSPPLVTTESLVLKTQQRKQVQRLQNRNQKVPTGHNMIALSSVQQASAEQSQYEHIKTNITYLGPNTRGIVVPIVSSSATTTAPLTIASARLQSLNRQLAQARALKITNTSNNSTNVMTVPMTIESICTATSVDVKPITTHKMSLTTTPVLRPLSLTMERGTIETASLSSKKTVQNCSTPNFSNPLNNKIISTIIHTNNNTSSGNDNQSQFRNPPPIKTVSNGSAMYSVLYTGIGNKITIKRKIDGDEETSQKKNSSNLSKSTTSTSSGTLKSTIKNSVNKRRGCRCGNATPTPGKLTCCGQRCPCYVEAKSCIGCKCRGCRNPHRPDGGKVRPIIPELACYEIQMVDDHANLSHHDLPIATTTNMISSGICRTTNTPSTASTATNEFCKTMRLPSKSFKPIKTTLSTTVSALAIRQSNVEKMSTNNSAGLLSSKHPNVTNATLIPIRSLQNFARNEISAITTSVSNHNNNNTSTMCSLATSVLDQSANIVNGSLTNHTTSNMLQLEQLPQESVLMQNAEGKFHLVNLFSTSSASHNSNAILNSGINVPTTATVNNHLIFSQSININSNCHLNTTTATSTLPHIVIHSQNQHHSQHQQILHHQCAAIPTQRTNNSITTVSAAVLPLQQLQQQMKHNIITVHAIGPTKSTNVSTTPASATILTPSSAPASSAITLTPLIVSSTNNNFPTIATASNQSLYTNNSHFLQQSSDLNLTASTATNNQSIAQVINSSALTRPVAGAISTARVAGSISSTKAIMEFLESNM